MKKYIIIFNFLLLLIIAGCGEENLIQEDFKKDIDQVMIILDAAYEEKRELDESEESILDKFDDKYVIGKFVTNDGEEYEMNDIEKEIVSSVDDLTYFTDSEESLASEEDYYTVVKGEISKYMEMKEVPEELKGKYPTYEIYSGVHPQIREEALKIITSFDKIANGESNEYNTTDMYTLNSFVKEYEGLSFQIDDKNYLVNDESWNILYALMELKDNVEEGSLTPHTIDLFNETKDSLK